MNFKKIKLSSKVKVRTTQPECILVFDPSKDLSHEFNKTGSELFLKIYEGMSNEDIIQEMVDNYEISQEEATKSLEEFLDQIIDLGIASEV